MPASRKLASFNRRFTNRLLLRAAGHLPMLGIVRHRGRKSGRAYRTPVMVFHHAGGYLIALGYGPQSDWARNVLAAGWCELQTRGRRVRLFRPHIETDESKQWAPPFVKFLLDRFDVPQYMRLSASNDDP
ncbi:MAG: nitroreductase family deazaflavin-dependent oxidoreductase [Egibacteraceae bacterium]